MEKIMKKIFAGIFCFCSLFCFFPACKTSAVKRASGDSGLMYAMVYDYENIPVTGALVFIDGKNYTETDINGRFIMNFNKPGNYHLRITKQGYETVEQEFKFDPMNVLYLKLINLPQLLALAENALDRNNFPEAEGFITRALSLDQSRPDALFLKGIMLFLQKKYDETIAVLKLLIETGYRDNSVLKLLELSEKQAQSP
jgi:tetratricopeptide (TPR) repeat protein